MNHFKRLLALFLVVLVAGGMSMAKQNKLPLGFSMEPALKGFDRPSAMAMTNDGRIYVGERYTGNVYLVRYGKLIPTPLFTLDVSSRTDEGLLDMAYAPAGPGTGYLFTFYTDDITRANRVVRYTVSGLTATNPFTVIDLGSSPGGTRVGGGVVVGNDGKLYISVGDMETSANAQNSSSIYGKVLRLNVNGTIPVDNPTPGSAVYAKGFRDGVGIARHPATPTLYQVDRGPAGGYDELNAVSSSGNYGWNIGTGPLGSPYTDPIDYRTPLVNPSGMAAYTGTFFPDWSADGTDNDLDGTRDERHEKYGDSVFYGLYGSNDIIRSALTGANLTSQDSALTFFDSDIEWDGTADTLCPAAWTDFEESGDQVFYGLSEDVSSNKDGIYRMIYNRKGAREVSPPGSIFPLTLEKNGSSLDVYWENLDRDAWIGTKLGATQPNKKYTIWEGTLPISGGSYNHSVLMLTDGTAVNDGLLTQTVTGGSGSRYYLVSSQSGNLEGTLGWNTAAQERTNPRPTMDYCNEIGWWTSEDGDAAKETRCDNIDNDGDGRIDESCAGTGCAPDFKNDLGQPVKLLDQYGNYWTLHDFRDELVHMDISSFT